MCSLSPHFDTDRPYLDEPDIADDFVIDAQPDAPVRYKIDPHISLVIGSPFVVFSQVDNAPAGTGHLFDDPNPCRRKVVRELASNRPLVIDRTIVTYHPFLCLFLLICG
jgi:hypothetical protein